MNEARKPLGKLLVPLHERFRHSHASTPKDRSVNRCLEHETMVPLLDSSRRAQRANTALPRLRRVSSDSQ
jgi:hypothetical protein